jgi:hypothetical protein
MSDIVKLYNPANAAALTPEQTQGLQNLTTDEIGQLAKAYPNGTGGAYLLIVDSATPAHKQLPRLSTFQNLYNLRTLNGMKGQVAIGFKGNYKPQRVNAPLKAKRQEVVDLSDVELLNLPGFKTGVGTNKEENIPPETVQVTKVKEKKDETKETPKKKGGRPKKNTNPK